MKIKITNKDCGLEVGKEYDLCNQAAKTLIEKRQAVAVVEKPKPVKVVETKPVTKTKAKRKTK